MDFTSKVAVIVGAGSGISASVARRFSAAGMKVALASRNPDKLRDLCSEISAIAIAADASKPEDVARLFSEIDARLGTPEVVVYNAGARLRGSILDLDPEKVHAALHANVFGGFLVTQQAARRMVPEGHGTILLTGATASVKGYAMSAAFAMGKFGLRALAQSAARELGPKGIHVAHFVIDGSVGLAGGVSGDASLDPDAIAQTYFDVMNQHRSAWSQEVELRPWTETF